MISNNNKKTTKQTTPWHIWYNTQDEAYESTAKPQRKNELITRACHIMAPTLPHDHWPAERPNPKEKQRFPANKRADIADGKNTAIQIKPEKPARTRRMRPARPMAAGTWRTKRHAKSKARLHKHCPKHQPRTDLKKTPMKCLLNTKILRHWRRQYPWKPA